MVKRNFFYIHIALFLVVLLLAKEKWPSILLLAAQLVYVPVLFKLVHGKAKGYPYFAIPAYLAVSLIAILPSDLNGLLALVYLLFTFYIASCGIIRFLHRGFVHMEEFAIDCGMISLFVGGLWYAAYHLGIDTGFTPLITWLTAIHFHYSSFAMLLFIGLLGRLRKTKLYSYLAMALIILPWVMAAGISLSRWIEIVGVIIYIATIAHVIYYSIQTTYANRLQKWLVSLSFSSVGLTIIFALLYILSNGFGMELVTIGWMLIFHGTINAFIFGLLGVLGWFTAIPQSSFHRPQFPLSPIRKKFLEDEASEAKYGLVEDLSVYLPPTARNSISGSIVDFYERTVDYRLFAKVRWAPWFLPFAFIYKGLSLLLEQINLPLSKRELEMTGHISGVDEGLTGREDVRAWIRKIGNRRVFAALYSSHQEGKRTYMNIALPFPFTSMHGILALDLVGEALHLRSEGTGDEGIYLAFGNNIRFRLPLKESFIVYELAPGKLAANHQMTIFHLPFLQIDYRIEKGDR